MRSSGNETAPPSRLMNPTLIGSPLAGAVPGDHANVGCSADDSSAGAAVGSGAGASVAAGAAGEAGASVATGAAVTAGATSGEVGVAAGAAGAFVSAALSSSPPPHAVTASSNAVDPRTTRGALNIAFPLSATAVRSAIQLDANMERVRGIVRIPQHLSRPLGDH